MGNKILIGILFVLIFLLGIGLTIGIQHLHKFKTLVTTPNFFPEINSISIDGSSYEVAYASNTHSMLPSIPDNSQMIIVPIEKQSSDGSIHLQYPNAVLPSTLKLYDIVCFNTSLFGQADVCHRITKIKGSGDNEQFFMVGDNLLGGGLWINASQIDYKVVGVLY